MTFATKADADRWLAGELAEQAKGLWVDPKAGKVALQAYSDEWMRSKAMLAPKTIELYEYLLARLILPVLGNLDMAEITPARVRVWRAEFLAKSRPGPATVAKAYRLLSSIMSTAVIDNVVARNPCVEKGAGVERSPEMKVINPADVARLADAVDRRYRAMVLVAAYGGCRWGELAGLRRRHLDLAAGTVRIVEQLLELRGGRHITTPPKSAAGRRVVHLPAGVVTELKKHVLEFVASGPDALIFTSSNGTELRQTNFRKRDWLPAVEALGLDGFRFHDLRHVAGTLATVSGATIREVQARLGHASPAAAYRYQHVLDDRDAEIAARLDDVFRRASSPGA